MSVQDINPDSVLAAVQAGRDDIFELADHFTVLHSGYTLRSTVAALIEADRLVITGWRGRGSSVPILAVA